MVMSKQSLENQGDVLEAYYDAVVEKMRWQRRRQALQSHLAFRLGDISFAGKRVLDIGGGTGLYSFYAAARGAHEVTCLEPEDAGSTRGVSEEFTRMRDLLGLQNVVLVPETLQTFQADPNSFDIVLLLSSINHLDEQATINLLQDRGAAESYKDLFAKIAEIAADGAELVITDSSPRNIFRSLNMKHPFLKSVEWHKHQMPQVWAELLAGVGFDQPRINWYSFDRLGRVGSLLFANQFAAFFLTSYFRLHMRKTSHSKA
jgi:SAM-dependent methyltransferase